EYVLNGTKQFITHGSIAGTLVVFAQTDPEADHRGISAFVLERESSPWQAPKLEHKLGIRGSPTAQILFEDVRVPAANRLGDEGDHRLRADPGWVRLHKRLPGGKDDERRQDHADL